MTSISHQISFSLFLGLKLFTQESQHEFIKGLKGLSRKLIILKVFCWYALIWRASVHFDWKSYLDGNSNEYSDGADYDLSENVHRWNFLSS